MCVAIENGTVIALEVITTSLAHTWHDMVMFTKLFLP